MVLGQQFFSHHRIIHHTCNLAANEISGGIVGLLVQQNVEVSQCKTKTQTVPRSFIRFLALFRCDIQSRGFVGHETQAGGRVPSAVTSFSVMGFDLGVFFIGHRRIGCRDAVVGRSLKHSEVLGLLGNDRGHLHA